MKHIELAIEKRVEIAAYDRVSWLEANWETIKKRLLADPQMKRYILNNKDIPKTAKAFWKYLDSLPNTFVPDTFWGSKDTLKPVKPFLNKSTNTVWEPHYLRIQVSPRRNEVLVKVRFNMRAKLGSKQVYIDKDYKNVAEGQKEAKKGTSPLAQLQAKYPLTKLPKYYDAPWVQRWAYIPNKGSKAVFDLGLDKEGKRFTFYPANGDFKEFSDIKSLVEYALKWMEKKKVAPAKTVTDAQIKKWIDSWIHIHPKPSEWGLLSYIRWGDSIQIERGATDHTPAFVLFREGDSSLHAANDSAYLSDIGMDLKQFESWLVKQGMRKQKRPKPLNYAPYYD